MSCTPSASTEGQTSNPTVGAAEEPDDEAIDEPIRPLRAPLGLDPALVDLGGKLFHDPRLSGDGTISCASCHSVSEGGDDGLKVGKGIGGATLPINSPTVLNAGLQIAQFWNGRADTLEAQAAGPITAPAEMGSSFEKVLAVVKGDPEYRASFDRSFPDGVTMPNVLSAIATFERSLVTVGSRFDRWLRGDASALTEVEKEGYALFKSVGCIACHQGQNVGGNMFQRFGIAAHYFEDRGSVTEVDLGRFAVTGEEGDRYVFKVPSLRMVAATAPYLHDGSAETLEKVIAIMGRYQLGRELEGEEIDKISAFLRSLAGVIPDVSRYEAWAVSRRPVL